MTASKQEYEVVIFRKDGQNLSCFKSFEYSKCKENWQEYLEKWSACAKETIPFSLVVTGPEPLVTAFEPGMISEIKILPVQEHQQPSDNPFANQMQQQGLHNTMRGYNQGPDILDNGYIK